MVEYWILALQILQSLLGTALAIWVGGTKSYVNTRMENAANHADIAKLADQMGAITQTTKTIEAQISHKAWDYQSKLDTRREALFNVVRELESMLLGLGRVDMVEIRMKTTTGPGKYTEAHKTAVAFWNDALISFKRAKAVAVLVCSKDLRVALDELDNLIVKASDDIYWDTRTPGWFHKIKASGEIAHTAMRRELDIE